jgi:signal transduction histidine kinase/ActR/RegA family two-component response regulator
MPVIINGKAIGSLCVVCNVPKRFTETEINIISTLSKALSLEQQRFFVEESLIKATDEAKIANKVKSQFLANMSHEIRTPLNGIIGFAEMLSSQEPDERKARILNMIEDSGYQLLQIINDIFDYSRIETGKISLKSEAFKLNELIEETVNFFHKPAQEKGLHYIINTDKITENHLLGDSYKFKQVMVNVISNAIKFTDDGSVLVIAGSIQKDDLIEVKMVIEDTGIGISNDQLDKIFDEFKQVEYYLTKKIKGTGLGLTITKKLLDLMNGKIVVESEQGKGSRFIITVPFKSGTGTMERSKEEYMNKPEIKRETDAKKIKILLAEDNEANQFLIKVITKSQDWDITIVENGAEAIEKYKSGKYDIILMDVQMPIMNGYEATKIIRQIEFEKGMHTPIIALTAYAMKSDKDICIEAGMDDYISKPFKRQQFLETINDTLARVV